MTPELFEKIAKEAFPHISRLTLYGDGESLVHPNFLDFLDIARRYLPRDSEIFFVTNGSLLNEKISNIIVEKYHVNEIAFSIDTTDFSKLEKIRLGAQSKIIFRNLVHLLDLKKNNDLKIGISSVVMRSNVEDLPDLVEKAGELNIDYVVVSHLLPYSESMYREILYPSFTGDALRVAGEVIKEGWPLVLKAIYEELGAAYGQYVSLSASRVLREIWKKAEDMNLEINLPMMLEAKPLMKYLKKIEEIFEASRRIAKKYGIRLELPSIFPDGRKRECPYIKNEVMVIRWDGKVVPCMNYIHEHSFYINNHDKWIHAITFGDLKTETVKNVWNKEEYVRFRENVSNISKSMPWCGDCLYSSLGCWYVKENLMDCYGNTPTCSECVYSVNLAKCLI